MRTLFVFSAMAAVMLLSTEPLRAQTGTVASESPLLASHFETWEVESRTTLGDGDRQRIVYTSDADTAVVWTNLDGEPRIVRAWLDGQRFARTLTAGTFPLSDSLIQAYRWMQDETFRRRLQALLDDEAVTTRNQ